jgi:N-alpha-acetyltransferase 38, NatC auxiliary subunit
MTANDSNASDSHPFLGRELRVELTDGRVIVGTLIAYEGSGDLLLQAAVEQRAFKDGEITVRGLNLLAIPFKHVKTLHRRQEGLEPIVLPSNEPEQSAPTLQI